MPIYNPPSPVELFRSTIPFIIPSSGTMGNNGALSGVTAIPQAYPSSYIWVKAAVISAAGAGSAAGWYFAQWSSTTAATVFNNVYDPTASGGLPPTIPASPTAFSTTGAGAYTQDVSAGRQGPAFTLPAGTLGLSGKLVFDFGVRCPSSANAKSALVRLGGTAIHTTTATSTSGTNTTASVVPAGANNIQWMYSYASLGGATSALAFLWTGSFNFANALVVDIFPNMNTATEFILITHFIARLER